MSISSEQQTDEDEAADDKIDVDDDDEDEVTFGPSNPKLAAPHSKLSSPETGSRRKLLSSSSSGSASRSSKMSTPSNALQTKLSLGDAKLKTPTNSTTTLPMALDTPAADRLVSCPLYLFLFLQGDITLLNVSSKQPLRSFLCP